MFLMGIITKTLATKFGLWEQIYIADAPKPYLDFDNALFANLYALIYLALIIGVATLAHFYVEKPCIAFGKKIRNAL